jgi:hypothetical protein
MGLDTKTYWLTDRQSQCDFDFDLSRNGIDIRGGWSSPPPSEFSEGDSHGKFVEDLKCDLKTVYV